MIAKAIPEKADECRKLWKEAQELTLIFSSILKSDKSKVEQRNSFIKDDGSIDM